MRDSFNYVGLYGKPPIEKSIYIGGALCGLLLLLGAILEGSLLVLLHIPAFLLVCIGTVGATLMQFAWNDVKVAIERVEECIRERGSGPRDRVEYLVGLAGGAKQEGLMYVERESRRIHDKFLRLALEMAVDGYKPEDIRQVLENDLHVSRAESHRAVTIFESLGAYAPAMGLIGTLLGLIGLLGELGNPSALGASMSVALLSTLYGAILSNMLFLPLAGRIETRALEELQVKQITLEGALCLARQESPIIVGQRLGTFLVSGADRGAAAA